MIDLAELDHDACDVKHFDDASRRMNDKAEYGLAAFTALVHEDSRRVLMVQLGDYARRNFGGNPWTLPGGKIEVNEAPSQGACREIAEETGIELSQHTLRLAAWLTRPYLNSVHRGGELILLYVAQTPRIELVKCAPPETIAGEFQKFDYRKWLTVPETGCGEHPLQPLRKHWIYWTYLAFECLEHSHRRPHYWNYPSAVEMRLPPWNVE